MPSLTRSESSDFLPIKERAIFKLKNYDIHIELDVITYASLPLQPNPSTRELSAHLGFKERLRPSSEITQAFCEQDKAEVKTIGIFFPQVRNKGIRIAFSAWLATAIVLDDLIERLPAAISEASLVECIKYARGSAKVIEANEELGVKYIMHLLVEQCLRNLSKSNADAFFRAMRRVFLAHIEEIRFQQHTIPNDMETYMTIRAQTIALDPFFEVLKREYLPREWRAKSVWIDLQQAVCWAAGLQNDLVGLERDLESGENMNAVIVLLRRSGVKVTPDNLGHLDEALLARCIQIVNAEHNKSVSRVLELVREICTASQGKHHESVMEVTKHISLLVQNHFRWCSTAKRYTVSRV